MNLTELTGTQEDISEYLSALLPENWDSWTLEERRSFWAGDRCGGTDLRMRVCAKEVWLELYCGTENQYDIFIARAINRQIRASSPYWRERSSIDCGPLYGHQRGFAYDLVAEKIDNLNNQLKSKKRHK